MQERGDASLAAAVGRKKFLDEEACETGGVVAKDAMFIQEVLGDDTDFQSEDFVSIEQDRFSTFGAVTPGDLWGDGFAIGDNCIDDAAANMMLDGTKVVA